MASRLLRRSGVAVGLVCDALGWRANTVIQAGLGLYHQEVDVLKAEWPGLRWYAVDPHPGVIAAANLEGKVDLLIGAAASDYRGRATLWMRNHHADGSALVSTHESDKPIEVECNRLDDLFDGITRQGVDPGRLLLWFDVEGHEVEALAGAGLLLARASVVNVELTGRPEVPTWADPGAVHGLLERAGWWAQWQHTGRITAGQRDVVFVKPELFRPDLCCFPWEVARWKRRGS